MEKFFSNKTKKEKSEDDTNISLTKPEEESARRKREEESVKRRVQLMAGVSNPSEERMRRDSTSKAIQFYAELEKASAAAECVEKKEPPAEEAPQKNAYSK